MPPAWPSSSCPSTTTSAAPMAPSFALLATSAFPRCRKRPSARTASASPRPEQRFPPLKILRETTQREIFHLSPTRPQCTRTPWRTGVMGLPLPLATCLSWVGPPSNLGGGGECARCVPSSQSEIVRKQLLKRPVRDPEPSSLGWRLTGSHGQWSVGVIFLFYYRSHIILCPCARGISAFD